jgi:hypothetical protein
MYTDSNKSTTMLSDVIRIVHLIAFQTSNIGLTGMGTVIIQITEKKTGRQTMNHIRNRTMAVRIQKPQSSGL